MSESPAIRPPSRYGRWRAVTLTLVYLFVAIHVAHWKIAGKTLAPLELNEVMYTLELGVITVGFLFMAGLFLSAALFGRFFCSWACHILALQDLCSWLLKKVGVRPRPVRSRVLLWVPMGAMLYMFVWPQIKRLITAILPSASSTLGTQPPFELKILADADGWASFVTTDFTRNLPGPGIAITTFLVCGFAIVYFLGSRSFCTYGCPYGALFGLVDRFAPGRITLQGECTDCGRCTAVCQSRVNVHKEVKTYGKVVNSSCLKDLDCVEVCPTDGLAFAFSKPPLFGAPPAKSPGPSRYDFSVGEDVLMAAVFLVALLAFRGLYALVPFLLTLGIGAILAYLTVIAVRLLRKRDVRFHRHSLRVAGKLTTGGRWVQVGMSILLALTIHSTFVRYHEWQSDRLFDQIGDRIDAGIQPAPELLSAASGHLQTRERWGLLNSADLDRRFASIFLFNGPEESAEKHLRRLVERNDKDHESRFRLGRLLGTLGRGEEARSHLERVAAAPFSERDEARLLPLRISAHELLGSLDATAGDIDGAIQEYEAALSLDPGLAAAHYNLAVLLAMSGREEEALAHVREATRLEPEDPEAKRILRILEERLGLR